MKKILFAIICYLTEINISFAALSKSLKATETKVNKTTKDEA